MKFIKRTLYLVMTLIALGGLLALNDYLREPAYAEKKARQFLQATPFTLEQFGKVDVRRRGDFNYYSWRLQNGEEFLELQVADGEACLKFTGAPDRRDICQTIKRNVSLFIECVRVQVDGELFINCGCIVPQNFVEAKHTPT